MIAGIKLDESSPWIDRHVIVEANRTFKGAPKDYCFDQAQHARVDYRKMPADRIFATHPWHVKRSFPFVGRRAFPWVNEGLQRDFPLRDLEIGDTDIALFSDIDEVIDSRCADRIVDETQKRGIVTIGMHVNVYYLNVFDFNDIGPREFSYRVFAMTGRYMRTMEFGIDKLRKLGEGGALGDSVYRIPGLSGFHLSWIGDAQFAKSKMQAYAHEPEHFKSSIYRNDGVVDLSAVSDSMTNLHHPMNPRQRLEVRDDIPLLRTVESQRHGTLANYFLHAGSE